MSLAILQCVATLVVVSVSASTVKWLPNSSFKLPENYKDGKLPCSKQTVVFPELVVGSIKIAAETEVSGFILPEDGELILDDLLTLGADPSDKNCSDGNAYYIDKTSSAWNQADVWSSPKFTDAMPDSDRVPCFNDVVEFPQDAKITVTLPKETQHVKALRIGNDSYSTEQFRTRVMEQSEQRQQFILNEYTGTGVVVNEHMSCTEFGCPCQIVPMKIDCSVKFCPKPACVNPIKPLGFCCEICGGYIVFDADKEFDMLAFHKFLEQYTSGTIYHVGFTPEISNRRIQLVVIDKGGYEGFSAEIVNSINYAMHGSWFKGPKVTQISGSPLYKAGLGGKIAVSMFFAVVLTLAGFYVYYYKLPDFRFRNMFAHGNTSRVLSRFQTRSESVVSLTRRDSVISTAIGATAFRNPMYDSKRGRVQVAETAVED